jgi:hypothetical protein
MTPEEICAVIPYNQLLGFPLAFGAKMHTFGSFFFRSGSFFIVLLSNLSLFFFLFFSATNRKNSPQMGRKECLRAYDQ